MLCPRCSAALVPTYRHGNTLAACPRCGGVWLESGVLDKLVGHGRHEPADVPAAPPPDAPSPRPKSGHDDDRWAHRSERD